MHKTRIKKKNKKDSQQENHQRKKSQKEIFSKMQEKSIKLIRIKKEEQKESVISFESQCRKTIDIK